MCEGLSHPSLERTNRFYDPEGDPRYVPGIASLAAEFAQYLRGLGDTSEFRLNAEALARDGFGPRPAFDGIVAEMAGAVVGYLLYHDGYDTDAAVRLLMVVDLFVTPAVRGQGIGAALMREAKAIAASREAKLLAWTVYRKNTDALRFYERIGGRYVEDLHLMAMDV